MIWKAWFPSSMRAQKLTFQPILQPVALSPRCSNVFLAAWNNSGFEYGEIWLLGYSPYKCEIWRCSSLGLSTSSSHSCSWLCFPICIGGNFSSVCLRESWKEGASPAMYEANKVLCSASKAIWLSMVQPAVIGPCSGDTEGDTTNHLYTGCSTKKSM